MHSRALGILFSVFSASLCPYFRLHAVHYIELHTKSNEIIVCIVVSFRYGTHQFDTACKIGIAVDTPTACVSQFDFTSSINRSSSSSADDAETLNRNLIRILHAMFTCISSIAKIIIDDKVDNLFCVKSSSQMISGIRYHSQCS